VSFFLPAKPGRLFSEGLVVNMGKTVAFMEATLSNADGEKLARATASARVLPVEKLPRGN
jgi:acyl-coenzyme A thioesterase PaaI-like protein